MKGKLNFGIQDKLLIWLRSQDSLTTTLILDMVLIMAPGRKEVFDMSKDTLGNLSDYLLVEDELRWIAGRLVYFLGAMDLNLLNADNIDSLIDNQNRLSNMIKASEDEDKFLLDLLQRGPDMYEQKRIFKQNWESFKLQFFNLKIIDEYIKENLSNGI